MSTKSSYSENNSPPVVESVDCIYANGRHNTTPDITRWGDDYYVVFISGSHHVRLDHVAVVLRSPNLKDWTTVYTSPYPARDTTLLALPDKLMMYYVFFDFPDAGAPDYVDALYRGEKRELTTGGIESRVAFTQNGKDWTEPQRVYEPNQNFWRPKVHDGNVYVASDYFKTDGIEMSNAAWYHGGGPPERSCVDLLCSTDGFKWSKVSTIVEGGGHTETELLFRSNGELWSVSRPDTFARSVPPYTEWRRTKLRDGFIGGPAMVEAAGSVYAAGRYRGMGKEISATALWKFDPDIDNFQRIALLPEVGHYDQSYPGFAAADDAVYMVYYSSHNYPAEFQSPVPDKLTAYKADIFLAKLNLV